MTIIIVIIISWIRLTTKSPCKSLGGDGWLVEFRVFSPLGTISTNFLFMGGDKLIEFQTTRS